MARGAETTVGLDIGTNSIKVVELRDTPAGISLVNFGLADIPPEAVKGDALAETLKEVITEVGARKDRIVSTLYGPELSIRLIKVPPMPKDEMKEAIKWETKKYISFPVDDALLDFVTLGEVTDKGVKKIDVLVAAAQEEMVNEHISLIQKADLKPIGIDVLPLALGNVLKRNGKVKEEESVALVEIGASTTHINVFKNNTLQFTRDFPTAGNSLTSALTEIPLSYEEAERKKREYGISEAEEGEASLISVRMRPILERLLTEIKRSFDYYREESGGEMVERLILSGGSARLKNLKEFLSRELGLRAEIANPFEGIIYKGPAADRERLENIASQLAVATGLALGKAKGINILPPRIRNRKQIEFKRALLRLSVPLSVIVLLFIYSLLSVQAMRCKKLLAVRKDEVANLEPITARLHVLRENKKRLEERMSLLEELTRNEPAFSEIMKRISSVVLDNVLLTELLLSKKERRFEIEGLVFTDELTPESTLVKFMLALEYSPYLENINLSSTRKIEEYKEALQFEITGQIK